MQFLLQMEDQVRGLRKKYVKASIITSLKSASKENLATESCSCGKDRVIKLAPPTRTLRRHPHTIMIFIDAGVTHAQTVDTRPLFLIRPGYEASGSSINYLCRPRAQL